MKFHFLTGLLLATAQPVMAQAPTQPQSSSTPQSAAQSESAGLQLEYQSVFEGYQTFSDNEIQDWLKSNQVVNEIGGWRVYAREAAQGPAAGGAGLPAANPSSASPAAPMNVPQVDPAHHQHGGAK